MNRELNQWADSHRPVPDAGLQTRPPASAEAVDALVVAHENGLLRYAYRLMRNRESAQDIVQEAFLRYLRGPLDYGEPRQRASWLYRVTHNLCIDVLKRESRRAEIYKKLQPSEVHRLPTDAILANERWDRIEGLLQNVSRDQRTVIVLFFQEGRSYKEISEISGFSMSNVGMLLHRGLKRLRDIVQKDREYEL